MKRPMTIAVAAVVGFNALIYLASPYYSAWRIMRSVESGSAAQMQHYIDFPSVQSSLHQQVDKAFAAQVAQDPMAAAFAGMIRPAMDTLIDELLQPDKLAGLIQSGKLHPARTGPPSAAEPPQSADSAGADISWYAFFDRPDRFRISAGELSLYMELRQWRWQLTAIGVDDLLEMDGPRKTAAAAPVADEIDTHSPPPPRIAGDRQALREQLAESFFITGDFSDKASVEGDFHYVPVPAGAEIEVSWLDARDAEGNPVLGSFTDEELQQREKFHQGKSIFRGQWQDKLPKSSADASVASARGRLKIELPTRIEHISLDRSQLNKLQQSGDVAANLTELRNGSVAVSLYQPYGQPEATPQVYVRNADGQPLNTPSSSSIGAGEPVENAQFSQPMRATAIQYSVAGTPASVDIYFPMEMEQLDVEFTATPQPQVIFGKLQAQITRTRYAAPAPEIKLAAVKASSVDGIAPQLVEETGWDKKLRRSLHFTLPDIGNSAFARLNYDKLRLFKEGEPLEFNTEQSRNSITDYQVAFLDASDGADYEHLQPDHIEGFIKLRYPARIETLHLAQGKDIQGATLEGAKLSFPANGNFPRYNSVFTPRSANAFSRDGHRIAYIPASDYWGDGQYAIFFWGEPAYVELKSVSEWIETEIPVDLSLADLQPADKPRG